MAAILSRPQYVDYCFMVLTKPPNKWFWDTARCSRHLVFVPLKWVLVLYHSPPPLTSPTPVLRYDHIGVTWASWRLKYSAIGLFVEQLVQANKKENFRAPHYWPICEENHRWSVDFPHKEPSNAESLSMIIRFISLPHLAYNSTEFTTSLKNPHVQWAPPVIHGTHNLWCRNMGKDTPACLFTKQ